jgi:DNA-binding SARP family transcriptional activator
MSSVQNPLQQSDWKLELFGRGQLVSDNRVVRLERKTAALFAFLALEGATSRSRSAGLLWADSTEELARSSLRQRLYRLRTSVGKDLIVSDEPLRLDPSLAIDAVRFESLIFTGEFEAALKLEGELLAGNDYDDCPDLNDWVLTARERLESGRREALSSEANRLETAGDYQKALGRAQQLLTRDPISEDGHRRVMRLHYLAGNRPAAIQAFEHCKTILETQLGIEPLPETQNLAKLISSGDGLPQTLPVIRISLPLQVLRPPVLAGRSHEWAQLEAAWEAGLGVIVRGEPGVGKTRLMLDFVGSKGAYVLLEGRPGDEGIPYATLSRGLKRILEQHLDLKLEKRQRQELSRILPELEQDVPPAIGSDAEKLRFFEAIVKLFGQIVTLKVQTIVADDLQFMDSASLEVWQYITAQFALKNNEQAVLHTCCGFRTAELEPNLETSLLRATQDGIATLIEIKSLETDGLVSLLHGLKLPGVTELAASLEQYTGGNPMYVLETLKSLLETGGVERGLPQHFPPPRKVGILIQHRLERLSPSALRVAQVAAVAETDFTLELAAKILEIKTLELTQPLQELERAQVLVGERFAHDLIFEATLEGVPTSIQNLVHKRTAAYLETSNGNPARIAQHWLDADEDAQAVPFLKDAALQAVSQYQLREAVIYATKAAQILEQIGNPELAWECWEQARDVLRDMDQGEKLGVVIKALHRTACTALQRAQSLNAECDNLFNTGKLVLAKKIALKAIEASETSKDFNAIGISQNNLGTIYWMQGETSLAADQLALSNEYSELSLQQSIDLHKSEIEITKARLELALGIANHAIILDDFGRYAESEIEHLRAIEMLREVRDAVSLSQALSNLSINLLDQGRAREALEYLSEAKQQEALLTETTLGSISINLTLSFTHIRLDHYTQALEYAHQAREIAEASQSPFFVVLVRLAKLYRILGATQQARHYFDAARVLPRAGEQFVDILFREYAVFLLEQGENASEIIDQALHSLNQTEHLYGWYKTRLELLSHVKTDEQMQIIDETLTKPGLHTMKGLHILALTRGAQRQLELGKTKKALELSQKAISLLVDYDPDLQRAEVLLTHYRALESNRHKNTKPFLEQTLRWLLEVADNHVPPEYRNSFLTCNPVNAAILEAARQANLELLNSVTLQ